MGTARAELSFDDPLTYLPRKPVQEFLKRRVIYDPQQPSNHLYVVIMGRVKLTNRSDGGGQILARIVTVEGFFGESVLVGPGSTETAVALDDAAVMSWSPAEIEAQIERQPRLGMALSQYVVRHCLELQDRLQIIAIYRTPERIMLALVQLADALGTPVGDRSVRLGGLTHQMIAEYVGTSRELVTFQLNRLRRQGLVRYSRRHTDVYCAAIRETLREQGIDLPFIHTPLTRATK